MQAHFAQLFASMRLLLLATLSCVATHAQAGTGCLSDCTTRIGIVSAFGAEGDILVSQTQARTTFVINGNTFTTGVLRGNPVVIALSGVSMINSTMVTQLMLDHFKVERLIMSGIAGGLNPALNVGDVTVPDRWVMPLEIYWSHNLSTPQPCGPTAGDVSCLGLKLAPVAPFGQTTAHGGAPAGMFVRENFVMTQGNSPKGEYVFAYPVDAGMLQAARTLRPQLAQCGPAAKPGGPLDPKLCVSHPPKLVIGGAGASATVFLANADYRQYLFQTLQANTFEMETAALAHVAYANGVPYIAFRSLSDLAGATEFNTDVAALFSSGLAETNEAAVTLAFLEAWKARPAALSAAAPSAASAQAGTAAQRPLKVVIISMFGPEAEPWIKPFALNQSIAVPGLSPDYPALRCNTDDVCLLTTGMGHANAAASTLALTLDPRFDLRKTYFLVAGIAGIDPAQGTLGTATWAQWLVDSGIAHELDARDMPKGWKSGYYGVLTKGPGVKPKLEYRTEVAQLDPVLVRKLVALTRHAPLQDSAQAKTYRARYTGAAHAAARMAPSVIQCDTLGGDTWWHGDRLGEHARNWTRLMTDGKGRYCTTQQEDNATYNALERAAAAGKVDTKRMAVLRTGSNFDRPYPGQSAHASLLASGNGGTGGFVPATQNLQIVGGIAVRDIVARWSQWQSGVPAD